MYRYTADFGGDPVVDMDENTEEGALNLSSSMSIHTSQSGSKAVLAALRALQDKIRRLDGERQAAVDECNGLKAQIKSMEIDFEHMKQRDSLLSNQALLEQRSAYDAMKAEKATQETEYLKLQERHREQSTEFARLKVQVDAGEEERGLLSTKVRALEKQCEENEDLLRKYSSKEKDMSAWILSESKRHEVELDLALKKIKTAQNDAAVTKDDYSSAAEKIAELEKLVGQLLGVNESLVKQVSGGQVIAGRRPFMSAIHPPKPANVFLRSSSSSSAYSQANLRKSSSSKAKKTKKTKSVPESPTKYTKHNFPTQDKIKNVLKSSDPEDLKALHSQFSSLYKRVKNTPTSSPTKKSSKKSNKVPKGSKTRLRRYSDGTPVTAATVSSGSAPNSPAVSSMKSPGGLVSIDLRLPSPKPNIDDILRPSSAPVGVSVTSPSKGMPPPSTVGTPFESVVTSLKEELGVLSGQYATLLQQAQGANVDAAPRYADDLMSVMQRMKRKEEQIAALQT